MMLAEISVGEYLLIRRRRKDLTISQLARILSVSSSTINSWERGSAMPNLPASKVERFLKFYQLSRREYFQGRYVVDGKRHVE